MYSRFDHVVLAVRDLEEATKTFGAAGFGVSEGGQHTGRGTCNAIIKFGLDYLELLSIYDEDEAVAAGQNGQFLKTLLEKRPGGLLGYALATNSIESLEGQFNRTSLAATGPFAVKRALPSGKQFDWRLLVPGGGTFRKLWPTIIQWDTGDEVRLTEEPPLEHANRVSGVQGVKLVVPDLKAARYLYEEQLGLGKSTLSRCEIFEADKAQYIVDGFYIDLMQPLAGGLLKEALERDGHGLFQVDLRTSDLRAASAVLKAAGATLDDQGGLLLPASLTMGSRIALVS